MGKCASTREIIEYLQAYEKLHGIGSVESIGSCCSGSRETEYVFHVEDENGNKLSIDIPSLEKNKIWENETNKKMMYFEKNMLWNQNKKIHAKFTRLSYLTNDYIYVGLLASHEAWTEQDYIDIMSYFNCVGFEKISKEEAKEVSTIGTAGFVEFLKLEKHS